MQRFMCTHTVPPHALSPEQVCRFAEAAQHDPNVRGYRSFMNLSEGRLVCVLEAPDRSAVAGFFQKMGMPVDEITAVEFEGEGGNITELTSKAGVA